MIQSAAKETFQRPSDSFSDDWYLPISVLTMHMQDWVIKARIVRKYDLYVRRPEEDEEKKQ